MWSVLLGTALAGPSTPTFWNPMPTLEAGEAAASLTHARGDDRLSELVEDAAVRITGVDAQVGVSGCWTTGGALAAVRGKEVLDTGWTAPEAVVGFGWAACRFERGAFTAAPYAGIGHLYELGVGLGVALRYGSERAWVDAGLPLFRVVVPEPSLGPMLQWTELGMNASASNHTVRVGVTCWQGLFAVSPLSTLTWRFAPDPVFVEASGMYRAGSWHEIGFRLALGLKRSPRG